MRTLRSNIPHDIEAWVRDFLKLPVRLPSYTVLGLPPAADWTDCTAICTNEAGGRTIVTSNGTNWKRVKDGATAS